MFGHNRAIRELRQIQQARMEFLGTHPELPLPPALTTTSALTPGAAGCPASVADGFLPPELRVPSRDEIARMMIRYHRPLVVDGEVLTCPQCGAYRDWVLVSIRGQVWLRCRAGHETLEPRLNAAWCNRNSGPMDQWHPTLEDGLKHLGH
ncbi:hypothetical protein [Streptomyces noursei]|uniref:hypothetical protein n=1 Tax=Streptomyces noursei TaxID=1971 RepID=UPI003809EB73